MRCPVKRTRNVRNGCSFVVNGPLTDRLGGRFAILISALGAAIMNALMGLTTWLILAVAPMPPRQVLKRQSPSL